MRTIRFKSRSKQINKISKDGLTRVDKVTGTTKNVSKREKAVSATTHAQAIRLGRGKDKNLSGRKRRIQIVRSPIGARADEQAFQKGGEGIGQRQRFTYTEDLPRSILNRPIITRKRSRHTEGDVPRTTTGHQQRYRFAFTEDVPKQGQTGAAGASKRSAWENYERFRKGTHRFRQKLTKGLYSASAPVRWTVKRVSHAAGESAHQKVREYEEDNSAVKAAHTSEETIERSVRYWKGSWSKISGKIEKRKNRIAARKIKKEALKEAFGSSADGSEPLKGRRGRWTDGGGKRGSTPHDNVRGRGRGSSPEGGSAAEKKAKAKKTKKAQHKRRVQEAAREAAQQVGEKVFRSAIIAVKKAVAFVRNSFVLIFDVIVIILFAWGFIAGVSSCGAMIGSITTAVISSYVAEDQDIHDTELLATKLEAELDKQIKDIPTAPEWDYIDEFKYDLDPIGHNPFVLMGYLTVKYQDFKYADMISVIQELHDKRYDLQLDVETETHYDSDDDPYTYYILNVTLRSKSIEEVIQPEFDADETNELQDWYDVLMETKGNHQSYKNPFDFDWSEGISSSYGYRVDPIGGHNLQIHRGLDIPVAENTPIKASLDGTVIQTGSNDDFGEFIVLYDAVKNRQIKYAHCNEIKLAVGQEVKAGETIIALSGNTGNSTGPHLHIEVKEDSNFMNPAYMVDWEIPVESE